MTRREMMVLAERIAKHECPIPKPKIDAELLAKSLLRLQGCKDVLLALPCSKLKN
jgi:hypothetical protein